MGVCPIIYSDNGNTSVSESSVTIDNCWLIGLYEICPRGYQYIETEGRYQLTVFQSGWRPKGRPDYATDDIEAWCRFREYPNLTQWEKSSSIEYAGWPEDGNSDLGFA